ncbi:hypothetical protein SDC9_59352 [bioreactor metagenome]|uniref:DUF2061 domain-containing protein n=1 Tax=bioreactor metagenome TaxID=1076179 RepID=A0A644XAN5_9ZZZZ
MKDTKARSIVKGISWRAVASFDTFVLGYIIFGSVAHASAIAGFEILTKIALFFLHERIWNSIRAGRRDDGSVAPWRSLVKSISYRFFGSLDTTLLSFLVTGNIGNSFILSGTEVVTKVGFFYLHERAWSHVRWGRIYEKPCEECPDEVPAV